VNNSGALSAQAKSGISCDVVRVRACRFGSVPECFNGMARCLILLLGITVIVGCGRFEGTFRFLRSEPDAADVPGIFVLDENSHADRRVRLKGYNDTSVQVVLDPDGTFKISRMPDCWLTSDNESKGGYDSCRGTWKVEKTYSVYAVTLSCEQWSPDSTYSRDKKSAAFRYAGALILTKGENGYGLALPLAAGDDGYLYFRRVTSRTERQKAPAKSRGTSMI
jgi:hypothetical protein